MWTPAGWSKGLGHQPRVECKDAHRLDQAHCMLYRHECGALQTDVVGALIGYKKAESAQSHCCPLSQSRASSAFAHNNQGMLR